MEHLQNTWLIFEIKTHLIPIELCKHNLRFVLKKLDKIIPRSRMMMLVSSNDLSNLTDILLEVPSSNILIQPENIGNAVGLLPLFLEVEKRDPHAQVLLLTHEAVQGDESFLNSVMEKLESNLCTSQKAILIGMPPSALTENCNETTWIVPEFRREPLGYPVLSIIPCASPDYAARLIRRGGLLATGAVISPVSILLLLYLLIDPNLVRRFSQPSRKLGYVLWEGQTSIHDLYSDILSISLPFLRVQSIPSSSLAIFTGSYGKRFPWEKALRRKTAEKGWEQRRLFH